MHKKFDHRAIEKKWQEQWKADGLYDVGERDSSREKEYVLVEWPYPSGNLHIGHWYAFAVPDIYARAKRMQGKQVLFPMGFDAFGLPAENAAIKRNINPKQWTNENIAYMKRQLQSMGNAFSWDKTTSSTDPDYYKWTQWMFAKFFEEGIAYRGKGTVNWCPSCNTVLANEQVLADDTCERCGTQVEKREMDEWKMCITKYADRLVDDLDGLNWPEPIKEAQRRWIGRSEGALIEFEVEGEKVKVFTTRPDTLYGTTYIVLAPEHEVIEKHKNSVENWDEVAAYIKQARQKKEQDRLDETKEKNGVELKGIKAINPANNEEIPVYVADYVLASYGTGAIMAVPAHDERDYAFAQKFRLPIKPVILKKENQSRSFVMGISEDDIQTAGATIAEKTDAGFFKVLIPFEKLEAYKSFIREKIKPGFWNEFSTTNGFYFIFKHKDGRLEEVELNGETNDLIDKYGMIFNDKTEHEIPQNVYSWLADNSFYREILIHSEGGVLVNSGEFDGMDSKEAKEAITKKAGGTMTCTYKLHDWSVGRQRYWGVPIPIVYDPDGTPYPVPEEHLPWILPEDVDFRPTGEPPLAKSTQRTYRTNIWLRMDAGS